MAYLYSSSKTWRRIVDATSRSAPTMLAFAAACVAVPWFLGDQVMRTTSKEAAKGESELEKKLRSRQGIQAQMLAKAQRERLQVMLDEIKDRSAQSEARYRAALDGQSLGTHSHGSSAGAVAIKRGDESGAASSPQPSAAVAGAAGAAGAAGQQADKGKAR
ncbi:hypothetical protein COHA_001336 [Chlorella ohadii]|uniref:Uncharacterized protein n=1 Tax=Chlorella ohadii TaxID=2649997 RepID=A0AAD5DZD1_9CHLO|nr:hypothetical protein COHA_001336 [Chlorella ohadii]